MSARDDESALRGHGPRPTPCDHECTRVQLGVGDKMWCNRCGALHADGRWQSPPMIVKLLDIMRSFRMTEDVPWRRELMDAALAGVDSPGIQTAPRYVPVEQHDAAVRDRDTMCDTLTIVQDRCTAQQEEIRVLRARLTRYGG